MKEEKRFVNAGIVGRHFSVQGAIRLWGSFTHDVQHKGGGWTSNTLCND